MFGLGDAAFVKDKRLARRCGRSAADLAEEGGKSVVISLAPALEGVVMALRTCHAHAEKELGNVLELLFRRLDLVVPSHGRVRYRVARGGE